MKLDRFGPKQGKFHAELDVVASEFDVFEQMFDVVINEVRKLFGE